MTVGAITGRGALERMKAARARRTQVSVGVELLDVRDEGSARRRG